MKKAELFHPRVFEDQDWAEGYYKRNAKNIERVGKRFVGLLRESGFEQGKILDVGCGFGAVAIEVALAFPKAEVIGVDLAGPLLQMAEARAAETGVIERVRFSLGDVQELVFEDASFDVVTNSFMLHVVEDPIAMLNEIERVVKTEARILITDLRRIWLGLLIKKLKTAYTMDEAGQIIKRSGLRPGNLSSGFFWWDYMVGV